MESLAIIIVALAVMASVASGARLSSDPSLAERPETPAEELAGTGEIEISLAGSKSGEIDGADQAMTSSQVELSPAKVETSSMPEQLRQDLTEFIMMVDIKKKLSAEEIDLIVEAVWEQGNQYDVDPVLLASLIYRESRFNPRAVSRSGAVGLGQIMPATARSIGVSDLYDIEQNVNGTACYFRQMLNVWNGYQKQIALALASYKEGLTRVKRRGGNYTAHTQRYINDIMAVANKLSPGSY